MNFQTLFERFPVVDDAVMDDDDFLGAVKMGVGILLSDSPVGGPTGVADTEGGFRKRGSRDGNFTDVFIEVEMGFIFYGDTPGVITAVLQALESLEDGVGRIGIGGNAEDSAHQGIIQGKTNLFLEVGFAGDYREVS